MTKTARVKGVRSPLKRKRRNVQGQISSKVPKPMVVICSSNYSIGTLSESQDSSTNSDSESNSDSDSNSDSELDDRPVQKKRKANDS